MTCIESPSYNNCALADEETHKLHFDHSRLECCVAVLEEERIHITEELHQVREVVQEAKDTNAAKVGWCV